MKAAELGFLGMVLINCQEFNKVLFPRLVTCFKRIYEANKEMSAGLKCLKNKLVIKYI